MVDGIWEEKLTTVVSGLLSGHGLLRFSTKMCAWFTACLAFVRRDGLPFLTTGVNPSLSCVLSWKIGLASSRGVYSCNSS